MVFRCTRAEQDRGKIFLTRAVAGEELSWDFNQASKLRYGKYTARLLLVYDDGQRDVPIESVVSFWVMPWRLIGVALIVALFALIGLKSTLQKVWRRFFKRGL